MAFAERVRRARRRRCCEARFSAAALSRASSSAAARAFASALDAVPSEPVELVRTGTAPKLPRHAASSKGLRGSSVVVRREAGDAPVDVRGVMPLTVGALGAAGLELSEDLRPGAHHGVALLAGVLVVKTCVSIWEARE